MNNLNINDIHLLNLKKHNYIDHFPYNNYYNHLLNMMNFVYMDDQYEVIPAVVAEKILLRDAASIVSNTVSQLEAGEDDPYADYKVPDDLMW